MDSVVLHVPRTKVRVYHDKMNFVLEKVSSGDNFMIKGFIARVSYL